MKVQSNAKLLDEMDSKIDFVSKMVDGAVDEATIHSALDTLHGMYSPYHGMVASWGSYMYPNENSWDPDHSVSDMVTQEVTDAHKQMGYIRGLEARLKGKDPNSSEHQADFDMLSKMKKDLGMKVDYKSTTEKREEDRASAAGWDGKVPTAGDRALKSISESINHLPAEDKKSILDAAKALTGGEEKK